MIAQASLPKPPVPLPALHLQPLNGSFETKWISLADGAVVVLGRPDNYKPGVVQPLPDLHNGYFDSCLLSREHAEVWAEDGKIYIRDTESHHGTFVNSVRLSPKWAESDVFQLQTGDVLQLGDDVFHELASKSVLCTSVLAMVSCVFTHHDMMSVKMQEAQVMMCGLKSLMKRPHRPKLSDGRRAVAPPAGGQMQ